MHISILVVNWNGEEFLRKCLDSVVNAAKESKHKCSVIVVDNDSKDRSIEYVKENFPEVRLIENESNRSFCSYNRVVERLDCEIVILLNNDLKVDKHFIDPLVAPFEGEEDLFFTASKCYDFDEANKTYSGSKTRIKLKWGILYGDARYPGHEKFIDQKGYTLSTGFGAFDRKKYVELGGYDDLYLPGRVEDIDLCYRGWKRGWKAYYIPESVVYHIGQATYHKMYGVGRTYVITHRNGFLFVWKNITDMRLILGEHLFLLFPRLIFSMFKGDFAFILGFLEALKFLPAALKRRMSVKPAFNKRDKEIMDLV